MCAEAYVLVFAGTDTSSNTVVTGLMHVLADEHVYQKLKQELTTAWPDLSTRPRLEELEKLPYLVSR